MIKLILFSVFPSIVLAAGVGPEIISSDDGKAIASTIKDIEVKDMLRNTEDFQKCREMNPFKAGMSDAEKSTQLSKAQDCFKDKLSNSKEEQLKGLSEKLNLQSYGLVKSNTVKDIQNYLNDKMYEVMTGVNLKEQSRKKLWDSMKFKNKKQIDQSTFITLYKAQLSKNALFEISRYCFEDFRFGKTIPDPNDPPTTFAAHWENKNVSAFNPAEVNDGGLPKFGSIDDLKDKDKIYESLFNSMSIGKDKGQFPVSKLSDFFMACGKMMVVLCDEFKKTDEVKKVSETDVEVNASEKGKRGGAASCLAKARLQEIKKAIAASELLEKDFESMSPNQLENALLATEYQNGKYKLFVPDKGDTSIDSLTNHSSADILEGGFANNSQIEQKEKDCEKNAELPACDGIIGSSEKFDKAKHDIEMEMSLKREVEIKRIQALKAGDKMKFREYLEQNGYFSIVARLDKGEDIKEDELSKLISEEYEAKKVAVLSEINSKLGKRQVSKTDANDKAKVEAAAKEAIKETKEERARLAQVVLFNNVITSYLSLERKDAKGNVSQAGRNVNAWNKEEQGLKSANVNSSLFQNLKSNDGGKSSAGMNDNEQIGGAELIDQILGKPKTTKTQIK